MPGKTTPVTCAKNLCFEGSPSRTCGQVQLVNITPGTALLPEQKPTSVFRPDDRKIRITGVKAWETSSKTPFRKFFKDACNSVASFPEAIDWPTSLLQRLAVARVRMKFSRWISNFSGFEGAQEWPTSRKSNGYWSVRTLVHRFVGKSPGRLIGDKAYDDSGLGARLRKRNVRMISPRRNGSVRPAMQNGRELRHYVRRWKIERLFSWLENFRRICNRWEHQSENFAGFVKLADIRVQAI